MSRELVTKVSTVALMLAAFALPGCGHEVCDEAAFADSSPPAAANGSTNNSNSGAFGSASSGAGSAGTAPAAQRAIAEADIIQLNGSYLYAMSKSGTVSIVDVSVPGQLSLLGQTTIPGQPFEMYLRNNVVVAMTDAAFTSTGAPIPPVDPNAAPAATPSSDPASTGTSTTDPNDGAAVVTIDVTDPAKMSTIALFPIPGALADSRIVGDVLYIATYENAACFGCSAKPRTMVTSYNVANPNGVVKVDQASFQSDAPDGYNLPWGSSWQRSIIATDTRLYIGGHADIDPADLGTSGTKEGIIDVLDITDRTGVLGKGARLNVAGAVLSRWQMDETAGVLRVISQQGAGRTGNGLAMPEVATFAIADTQTFTPLGLTTLTLPMQEGLRTVRFDTNRAYAITYNQTDPLFTIDLTDPSKPLQRGSLSMPGFMFYLEPHGDRVIGLGVDRTDPGGSLNVSLFDVSNMDAPAMLKRVAFGAADLGEDYAILNYEVPEDQDRIQKAFKVFDDGRVAVPFTSTASTYDSTDGCTNPASGVQLVNWQNDTLTKDALLPVIGNPRRAIELSAQMIAVSDSNVTEFSLAQATYGKQEANLTIGTCLTKSVPPQGSGGLGGVGEGDNGGSYNGYGQGAGDSNGYITDNSVPSGSPCGGAGFAGLPSCAVGVMGARRSDTATFAGAFVFGLFFAAGIARRRRAK